MATSIFTIIGMHIRLIKLLKVSFFNIKYDLKQIFCEGCTGANYGYNDKIKEAIIVDNNKNNNKKDF